MLWHSVPATVIDHNLVSPDNRRGFRRRATCLIGLLGPPTSCSGSAALLRAGLAAGGTVDATAGVHSGTWRRGSSFVNDGVVRLGWHVAVSVLSPELFMPQTIWRSSMKAPHGTISCIAHLAPKTRRCPR